MLSELRIANTQAVEAQPRASVSATIAWSCSVSSNPPYLRGLRMWNSPASCSARKTWSGIARSSSVSRGVLAQERHELLRGAQHLRAGERRRGRLPRCDGTCHCFPFRGRRADARTRLNIGQTVVSA